MRDDDVREALLTSLDADRDDAVSQNALADWFEEKSDAAAAACFRWVARNRRRPGHYPRATQYGHFFWELQEREPIINDAEAQLPAPLWRQLKDNDEETEVASFKSYQSARAAYADLVEAWRSLREAVPDVG
jgi:hypothetical protein